MHFVVLAAAHLDTAPVAAVPVVAVPVAAAPLAAAPVAVHVLVGPVHVQRTF